MSKLRSVVVVSCLASLLGCENLGREKDGAGGDLVVVAANPTTGLEARYTEGGHTIVLRSRSVANALQSDFLDRDQSINARARAVLQQGSVFRTADGEPVVAVKERFADAVRFAWTLKLTRHALRRLPEVLPREMADGPHLGALEQEVAPIRDALAKTKLMLLEEWASEVRRQLVLTPEEHARFFAVFHRQAEKVAASATQKRARMTKRAMGAVAPVPRASDEIETLLGAERYQKYLALQKSWIAENGGNSAEVLP